MKGKKRKGASLPMVIITMLVVTAMVAIMASVIDTGTRQTQRMYEYLNAKYVATSGIQLALGAYYGDKGGTPTALYNEFANRATKGKGASEELVKATHDFQNGRAEIEMSGEFSGESTASGDYYITVKSKAKLANSEDYYVHEVTFNWTTNGIRSEKGGLATDDSN